MADIKVGLELKGRLPDEYQEVEYIRSNGTQYINTLIKINPYTKVVCDFRFIEIPNSNSYLFGSLDESTNCFAVYRSGGGVFSYQFTDGWVNNKWTNIPIDTNRHLVELDALNKIIKIDNGNTLDEVISTSITTVSTMPLYIFSRSNSRGDLSEFSSIELYSFKVYQNNALKNNFVPCYNKNTKIAGLYDTYNNKFFENAGDGDDFIVGENANINEATLEDISLIQNARIPFEFQEVEYIESTGTQYIDTGIVGESGVYVQCKIEMMEIQEGCIIGARSGGVRYFPIHIYQEVFGFGNGSSWVASTYKPVINTIYEIQSSIKSTSQSFSINGSTVISKNENSQNNTNLNMFLFAMNTDGTNRLSSKFRLYNMIIANTLGQVVRNFVPCYRVSDRATGLYDLLSKEFFPNLGSGEFLLGENKGNIVEVSNTSILLTGDTFNKLSEKNNGLNMKSWASGYLSLSDGFVGGKDSFLSKQNGYDGYVFGEVSNNNEYPVTLQVNGEQIKWILIYGDKSANQFPTEIIVDGKTISNNSVMCIVGFEKMANSHQVEFVKWNRANYNACFTHIGVFANELVLDKRWIKSVESLSQSTGQPKEIYYGITPSSGSLEILDNNGEIRDYINDGILSYTNVPISIFANNKKVGDYIATDCEYEFNNTGIFNGYLSDILNNLDTYYSGVLYYTGGSLLDLFALVTENLSNDFNLTFDMTESISCSYYNGTDFVTETKDIYSYLSEIYVPYYYIPRDTYRNILNKFCTILQCNMYIQQNNVIKFISARPLNSQGNKLIIIPKKNQFTQLQGDIFVKNKISTVNCPYNLPVFEYSSISQIDISTFRIPSDLTTKYSTYSNVLNSNSNISVIKTNFQDRYSYDDSSLIRDFYSIIKYSVDKRILSSYNITQFKFTAKNTFFVNINGKIEQSTETTIIDTNTSKPNHIEVYDSSSSDSDILKGWIGSGTAMNPNVWGTNVKIRQNKDNIDVFVGYKQSQIATDGTTIQQLYPSQTFSLEVKEISFDIIDILDNANFSVETNELIQYGTVFKNTQLYEIISHNISQDYSDGLRVYNITISCSNYYYQDGEIAKDWDNGEMLNVGDFVKIDGIDHPLRVVSRNFRYSGVPMLDLELQEVRAIK